MSEINNLIIEKIASFTLTEPEVISKLSTNKSWDAQYREIMLLGKQLPVFGSELKLETALISGCESQVWLHHIWQDDKITLIASSDSKIVRGLLAIVLVKFNNKSKDEIGAIDIESYFSLLNLSQHLSPSRSNGLAAIVETIKSL